MVVTRRSVLERSWISGVEGLRLLGALAKADPHDEEVSGLQKKCPGWRSCFVSSSVGVWENG